MVILNVTPVRNVLISKGCFKSERMDMFFNKVFSGNDKIDVYDVTDRKSKTIFVSQIIKRKHRIIINGKKFFICSIRSAS